MNTLSPEYKKLLEQEHAGSDWGTTGWRHAPRVHQLAVDNSIKTVLDYGAGYGRLGHWFDRHAPNLELREYEPGIPRLAAPPSPAELVACIDVMEHIEPDYVTAVLDHIQELALCCVYFNISLRAAGRTLADGRNAHLTIQPQAWWLDHLRSRWQELDLESVNDSFTWTGLVRA